MVRIVNWLLTRRCNLKCEYCGIVDNRKCSLINENEMSTERVTSLLEKFKVYNPHIFHIFYGGEPFMRRDLIDIVRFCNDNDINYTVISNCTTDIQPKIVEVIEQVGLKGLTGSVDPSILKETSQSHSQLKSAQAFAFLFKVKREYDIDVVAEVTMTKKTLEQTYPLVKVLSSGGIYSSITAIDINKNYAYDFSAYSSEKHLIKDSKKLTKLYKQLMDDDSLLIHMKDIILEELFRHIDSTYDCQMEEDIHNLTIDADGRIRTCLRISGGFAINAFDDFNVLTPKSLNDPHRYTLHRYLSDSLKADKFNLCKGCNHTCVMMSKYANDHDEERIINH